MKTLNEKFDAMAEVKKHKNFKRFLRSANLRLRLAEEIYLARETKGLSQQELAKKISSTQKVISNIENGDVNIGIDMLDRLSEELEFTANNFVTIFPHLEKGVIETIPESEQVEYSFSFPRTENIFCNIFSEVSTAIKNSLTFSSSISKNHETQLVNPM